MTYFILDLLSTLINYVTRVGATSRKRKEKKTQTKTKQGSSDKGQSEIYDCSEWKTFLAAVTPFAIIPTVVMLLEFTRI